MPRENVLIIGGGGREHVLAWKIKQSPRVGKLFVAPGNAGTSRIAENVALKADDISALVSFARDNRIGLTVVGPDDSLAAGIVDAFQSAGLRIFGPTRQAAQIEWSKVFAKNLMSTHDIPTACYETFANIEAARSYVESQSFPLVVKASGLALGKGVYVCQNLSEAQIALEEIMTEKVFGESGNSVVIEDFMEGQEVSIQALHDGTTTRILPVSQDHKRIGTGDLGPNTGGMGTYAPVPWVDSALIASISSTIVDPALAGLNILGAPFKGMLYPGLMINKTGAKVVEFNARFGDPEPQSYLRLLETDMLDLLDACVDGKLAGIKLMCSDKTAVCVVLASGGYPGHYETGFPITGIDKAEERPDIAVFHAGTKYLGDTLVTAGGRVLGVTATGSTLSEARKKAYDAISYIHFDGMQYRTDIGLKPSPR
jgi:phosphoribosylamine--glycine ligase